MPVWMSKKMTIPYDLSIAKQRSENIVEMTIPYDLSIALQRTENIVEIRNDRELPRTRSCFSSCALAP